MNFGFNSNVRTEKGVFHVQTEDRGPEHPFLDTVVYLGGRVVHKRSTSYKDLVADAADPAAYAALLHARLSDQHKDVIAQVEAGTLNLISIAPSDTPARLAALGQNKALTVQLLNTASWLGPGGVTLQVNIQQGKETAGGAEVESFFESSLGRSMPCRAIANGAGFAEMKFPMPTPLGDNVTLVIRATLEDDRGELRFLLKPAKDGPISTTPAI